MSDKVRGQHVFDELIGVDEAARLLGVPRSWIYSAAEAGRLPSFKVGKYRRFRCSELTAWLEDQRNGGDRRAQGERRR